MVEQVSDIFLYVLTYIKVMKSWSILCSNFNTISGLLGFYVHLFLKLTISLSVYANIDDDHIPVEIAGLKSTKKKIK